MLGHLRMNIEEAIDALITVATAVFVDGSRDLNDKEGNSKKLKEAIENLLRTRRIPISTEMRGSLQQATCKVSVLRYQHHFP